MSDSTALERAIAAVLERHAVSLKHDLLKELGGAGPGMANLCVGFSRITNARNQTEIMQVLLEAADIFSGRCAVLVVKGDRLAGWRGRGFDDAEQARLRQVNLAPEGQAGWKQALNSSGPVAHSLAQSFFDAVGAPSDGQAYLLPLLVKERPVAMLYADSGEGQPLDSAALELLTRTAGMWLEISATRPRAEAGAAGAEVVSVAAPTAAVEAPPAAAGAAPPPPPPPVPVVEEAPPPPIPPPPPPRPARATGPDLSNFPPAEHEIHKKAFRYAKLLVDELVLYNKDKVAEGKRNRDVYSLLQEDIDKSRLAYGKKFANTPAAKVDYFHQQIVQIVGDGDPGVLGSGYPGPLV